MGLFLMLALPAFTAEAPQTGPGQAAQKIIQLSKAGVEDSVILTYVQTQTVPLAMTNEDFGFLKAAGISPVLLTAIAQHDSQLQRSFAPPLTEAQLYRLFGGVVYHEGLASYVGGGLPNSMKQELESDPQARPYIQSFNGQNGSSQVFAWTGFGLLVGGLVYSGIADAVNPSNTNLNNAIGFSAVGTGVLSLIVGNVMNAIAYKSLYDGLYQYNRDLVNRDLANRTAGGNP